MPTLTKSRTPAPAEAVDLAALQHLNAHPRLAPLLSRHQQVRDALASLGQERSTLYNQLRNLNAGDLSMHAGVTRRQLDDDLAAVERQGAPLEEELGTLNCEITATEEALRQQLHGPLSKETLVVMEAFVAALETMSSATAAYRACCQRNHAILGTSLLPLGLLDPLLPSRMTQAQRRLEQLHARAE